MAGSSFARYGALLKKLSEYDLVVIIAEPLTAYSQWTALRKKYNQTFNTTARVWAADTDVVKKCASIPRTLTPKVAIVTLVEDASTLDISNLDTKIFYLQAQYGAEIYDLSFL